MSFENTNGYGYDQFDAYYIPFDTSVKPPKILQAPVVPKIIQKTFLPKRYDPPSDPQQMYTYLDDLHKKNETLVILIAFLVLIIILQYVGGARYYARETIMVPILQSSKEKPE